AWVEAIAPDERPALRLVYDTGGGSASYGPRWLEAGAATFVGHPGGNLAPVFYAFFLPKYVGGESIERAVREANSATRDFIYSTGPLLALAGVGDRDELWRNTEAQIFAR